MADDHNDHHGHSDNGVGVEDRSAPEANGVSHEQQPSRLAMFEADLTAAQAAVDQLEAEYDAPTTLVHALDEKRTALVAKSKALRAAHKKKQEDIDAEKEAIDVQADAARAVRDGDDRKALSDRLKAARLERDRCVSHLRIARGDLVPRNRATS